MTKIPPHLTELGQHRKRQAMQMQNKLRQRIIAYALKHKDQDKWKVRLYALSYGAGIRALTQLEGKQPNAEHLKQAWVSEAYEAGMHDALALLLHSDWLSKFLASIGLTQSFATGIVTKAGKAFHTGGVLKTNKSYLVGSGIPYSSEAIIPKRKDNDSI